MSPEQRKAVDGVILSPDARFERVLACTIATYGSNNTLGALRRGEAEATAEIAKLRANRSNEVLHSAAAWRLRRIQRAKQIVIAERAKASV